MRLRDRPEFAIKPKPLTCARDVAVREAVAAMARHDFGSVIVVDDAGRVEGLVTERDILKRLVNRGRDPGTTRVAEIMTSNPRIAHQDDLLLDWLRIMSNDRFRRLPVVDDDGRLVAVMTQGDFVSYTWPDLLYQGRGRPGLATPRQLVLIAGGIMAYSLIMILLLRTV